MITRALVLSAVESIPVVMVSITVSINAIHLCLLAHHGSVIITSCVNRSVPWD